MHYLGEILRLNLYVESLPKDNPSRLTFATKPEFFSLSDRLLIKVCTAESEGLLKDAVNWPFLSTRASEICISGGVKKTTRLKISFLFWSPSTNVVISPKRSFKINVLSSVLFNPVTRSVA